MLTPGAIDLFERVIPPFRRHFLGHQDGVLGQVLGDGLADIDCGLMAEADGDVAPHI